MFISSIKQRKIEHSNADEPSVLYLYCPLQIYEKFCSFLTLESSWKAL